MLSMFKDPGHCDLDSINENVKNIIDFAALKTLNFTGEIVIYKVQGRMRLKYTEPDGSENDHSVDPEPINKKFIEACLFGDVTKIRLLWNENLTDSCNQKLIDIHYGAEWALRLACANGHLEAVKLLDQLSGSKLNYAALDNYAFKKACVNGHVEMANFVLKKTHIEDLSAIYAMTIAHGQLDIIKQGFFIRCDQKQAFNVACRNGHLNIVKWLLEQNRDYYNPHGFYESARHPPVMYFLESVFPWNADFEQRKNLLVPNSISSGDVDCVKWVFEKFQNAIPINMSIIEAAIECGSLEVLEFIKSKTPPGMVLSTSLIDKITKSVGYDFQKTKNIFKVYGAEIKLPENTSDMYASMACTDNAENLKWLWELCGKRGFDARLGFIYACKTSKFNSMQWFLGIYPSLCSLQECLESAAGDENIKVIDWLWDKSDHILDMRKVFVYAVKNTKINVLDWIKCHCFDQIMWLDLSSTSISDMMKSVLKHKFKDAHFFPV